MAAISAAMVKELRDRTGLGMMECKKALAAADGDIEAAIEELRKSSGMKAAKKAGRVAAEERHAVHPGARDREGRVVVERAVRDGRQASCLVAAGSPRRPS